MNPKGNVSMLLIAICLLALLVISGHLREYRAMRALPHLLPPPALPNPAPQISVIIPARNEAGCIARCLDGVLTQHYPSYEVIVVDDHSTDATPSILARYAAWHPRLRVVAGAGLPTGWTGKAWACQQGAQVARGVWLVFLDADTFAQPDLLGALLHNALCTGRDVVSVFPFLELGSFWERLLLPPFRAMIYAAYPHQRIAAADAQASEVMANGQCILVRQSVYAAIGGHAAVKSDVLEDVWLARHLHDAGAQVAAVQGGALVQVRMYTSGGEVVQGLTKNASAGFRSAGGRAVLAGVRQFALALLPLWLLLLTLFFVVQSGLQPAALVALLSCGVAFALAFWLRTLLLFEMYRLPWHYTLLWPLGMAIYGVIVARSAWLVASGHGVLWKGRTYAGT